MDTHGGAKGCDANTLEMEREVHNNNREAEREADCLSKEESSDLACEEKRTHYECQT